MPHRNGKKRSKRPCTWFIEPLDSYSNEVIGRGLSDRCAGRFRCSDGRDHDLWECESWAFVRGVCRSEEDLKLNFEVWCRVGDFCSIRKFPFAKNRGPRSSSRRKTGVEELTLF